MTSGFGYATGLKHARIYDRKMGEIVTANESKSVTAHEICDRNRIISMRDDENEVVSYASRRRFVSSLTFGLRCEYESCSKASELPKREKASGYIQETRKPETNRLVFDDRETDIEQILIISALEIEMNPVIEILNGLGFDLVEDEINGRKYFVYRISNKCIFICTVILNIGPVNATIAVKDAMSHYQVSKVFMTGICGGVDRKMKFGDIIIFDQIVDYELAKISDGNTNRRWQSYRSDYELVQKMLAFKSEKWYSILSKSFPRYDRPDVYSGTVLSGSKVMADTDEVKELLQSWNQAKAIEMEAGGLAAALHQTKNAPAFVIVKAVSDFANSNKDDKWQCYAAYASASFVVCFALSSVAKQIR